MKILRNSMVLVGCLLAACGKYGAPIAPEVLAPKPVSSLTPSGTQGGVVLKWQAPTSDTRGRSLRDLGGYRVYRKSISKPSDVMDRDVEYVLLQTIEDSHIAQREALKAAARAEGRSTRSIKVEGEQTQFTFIDDTAKPGSKYLYKVVPFNEGGGEGEAGTYAQVLFRGDSTESRVFEMGAIQEPAF